MMRITLIGAGHSGFAAAAMLQQRGFEVLVYTRKQEKAHSLSESGILLRTPGAVQPFRIFVPVTSDLDAALSAADVLLVDTWANAHKQVFRNLQNRLRANQILLVLNGNWGAYEAWQFLHEEAARKNVAIGETSSQIFLGRLWYETEMPDGTPNPSDPSDSASEPRIPDGIHVHAVKEQMSVSGITREDTRRIHSCLNGVLTSLTEADSIFATSLSSANPIIHAPLSLFHLSQIERGEKFFFLSSTSQSVLDFTQHMDEERMRIAGCLHTCAKSALEEMNGFWGREYGSLAQIFRENPSYNRLYGPTSLQHRFIQEDIPFGTLPVETLAKLFDREVPYTSALLAVYRLVLGTDFGEENVQFHTDEIQWLLEENRRTGHADNP